MENNNHFTESKALEIVSKKTNPRNDFQAFEHWKSCKLCRSKLYHNAAKIGFSLANKIQPTILTEFKHNGKIRFSVYLNSSTIIKINIYKQDEDFVDYDIINRFPNIAIENNRNNLNSPHKILEYLNAGKPIKEITFSTFLIKTQFSLDVLFWTYLIPYGKTCTYGDIATWMNKPGSARAVGGALHNNPLPLVIPCHRVIGSDGKLVGFATGTDMKKKLLNIEQNFLNKNQIL